MSAVEFTRLLAARDEAGTRLRRLLAVALLVPASLAILLALALHPRGNAAALAVLAAGCAGAYAFAALRDISSMRLSEAKRRLAELVTRETSARYRQLTEGVRGMAVMLLTVDGRVVHWSGDAEAILGYTADEILGRPVAGFFDEEAAARGEPRAALDRAIREGRAEEEGWRRRKDGTLIWASINTVVLRDEAGAVTGFWQLIRDLTERRQAQEALQAAYDDLRRTQNAVMQQERLRVLGQMASGIAHDINNAISPIALYTESLLEREPDLSDRAREYLETIRRAIDDVASTVSRLREFYRPRETQAALSSVRLNPLVSQVIGLTQASWKDSPQQSGRVILLETHLDDALPMILGSESEIRDALTNLVLNAVDAMPEGGVLAIRTRRRGGQALLEVSDTGIGMDENTRRRCLEPFFTTKGERGTGLGLATVFGVIRRHGGEIEIDSEPGRGTTVRLAFPLTEAAGGSAASAEPPRPTGPLKLLVVDDDPLLLNSLRDTLQGDGHAVTLAEGGQRGIDAVEAAAAGGAVFDAVITDLGMPHVDGGRVAAAVKRASPETPVILLTGWGQRIRSDGEMPPDVDRVLGKPPRLTELRQALAELCSEPISR